MLSDSTPYYTQKTKHTYSSFIRASRQTTNATNIMQELWSGRTSSELQMNRLSLRNNRLKFKNSGELPITLEEFIKYSPFFIKENRRMSTCNRLDLQTLGSQPVMPKNLPDHRARAMLFSKLDMQIFSVRSKKFGFLSGQLPLPESTSPEKFMRVGGCLRSPIWNALGFCTILHKKQTHVLRVSDESEQAGRQCCKFAKSRICKSSWDSHLQLQPQDYIWCTDYNGIILWVVNLAEFDRGFCKSRQSKGNTAHSRLPIDPHKFVAVGLFSLRIISCPDHTQLSVREIVGDYVQK